MKSFEQLVDFYYKTIRSLALDFYNVYIIASSGCTFVNYHAIEISSS